MKYSGAKILIESLKNQGVEYVFGYPGGSVLDVYDEIYKSKGSIKHILMSSEQGATFAGDGFARASGQVGVVLSTSGPGATNLVTGIANSFLDSTPLVVITGNVPTSKLGQDSFQEVDIYGITMPVVKYSFLVKDVCDLEQVVCDAFEIAKSGRPGPILIDIPKDVFSAKCEFNGNLQPKIHKKIIKKTVNYAKVAEMLNDCKKPLIYCGGGVVGANAGEQVLQLAKVIDAPIVTTMMGKTAIPYDNKYNVGMTGMHGNISANQLKNDADLILALGVRFSDRAVSNKQEYQSKKIIHVDIDLVELNKNIECDCLIKEDVSEFLNNILPLVANRQNENWWNEVEKLLLSDNVYQDKEFSPCEIIKKIAGVFSDEDLVATDVGQHQLWTAQSYPFKKPRTFLTSCGLGSMGYGLGASIGGVLATKKKALLVTGDGSFLMNNNELAVCVQNKLPILIVIMNNGVLGMVKQWQKEFYHKRYSAVDIKNRVDFELLAKAYGVKKAYTISDTQQLDCVLEKIENFDEPILINCLIDSNEDVLPFFPSVK